MIDRGPGTVGVALLLVMIVGLVGNPAAANDLGSLSDEFNDGGTLGNWSRVHLVEQWNADQLATWDIDTTQSGRMVMEPHTCSWFEDYRGPFAFKNVTGDFVVTSSITTTGRDGASVPSSAFSLAGVLVRFPRNVTPGTWSPGGENYVFLSIGRANAARWQFEVKTTVNSNSTLHITDALGNSALIQVARLGDYLIMLRQEPGQPWAVHRRYARGDFPDTMQVGLFAYTDWPKVSIFDPFVHNSTTLVPPLPPGTDPDPGVPFDPDLIAGFDYTHYFRPTLPAHLVGLDLTSETLVPDAELLAFLGDHADVPSPGIVDCQGVDQLDVLTVRTGGIDSEAHHRVAADAGQSIDFEIVKPQGLGNGKFLAHLNAGEPGPETVTPLPAQLGDTCFALMIPPFGQGTPSAVWNGIGKQNRVGASSFFGATISDPGRAPTTFYSRSTIDTSAMPIGSSWTLQAVILNPTATSPKNASVTDAVIIDVR